MARLQHSSLWRRLSQSPGFRLSTIPTSRTSFLRSTRTISSDRWCSMPKRQQRQQRSPLFSDSSRTLPPYLDDADLLYSIGPFSSPTVKCDEATIYDITTRPKVCTQSSTTQGGAENGLLLTALKGTKEDRHQMEHGACIQGSQALTGQKAGQPHFLISWDGRQSLSDTHEADDGGRATSMEEVRGRMRKRRCHEYSCHVKAHINFAILIRTVVWNFSPDLKLTLAKIEDQAITR